MDLGSLHASTTGILSGGNNSFATTLPAWKEQLKAAGIIKVFQSLSFGISTRLALGPPEIEHVDHDYLCTDDI
jgi:hypothetical protein